MITSISIEAIEKQLLQQLSSFFFLSEEDEMLINIKVHNIQFFSIFLLTPFLKILITVYWQISCII